MNTKLEIIPQYPILFVHGIACRDTDISHTENCWGNIPEILRQQGIQVFFGNNDAWASIEDNARIIAKTINDIIEITQKPKVNIIAHSKGGLDARYAISMLHIEDKVASLTTINTPHRGVFSVDLIFRVLPKRMYEWIGKKLTIKAKKNGDVYPDVLTCAKELSISYCKQFNQKTADKKNVYYQSIHSYIRISSPTYWIPYIIGRWKGERMDGVISESSAKWGVFRKDIAVPHVNHSVIASPTTRSKKKKAVLYVYLSLIIGLASMGF